MTPSEFLDAFVECNLADFAERPGDIRLAFNAAVSASHLADHYFYYHERHSPGRLGKYKSIGEFVEHLTAETLGAFKDVRSVSNAYKHLYTDSGGLARYSSVDSCGSIGLIEISGNEESVSLESNCERQSDGEVRFSVVLTRSDSSTVQLLPLMETVVDLFRKLLADDA